MQILKSKRNMRGSREHIADTLKINRRKTIGVKVHKPQQNSTNPFFLTAEKVLVLAKNSMIMCDDLPLNTARVFVYGKRAEVLSSEAIKML